MADFGDKKLARGFTVIELMLAIMAFLLILTLVLLGVAREQTYRRDVTRTATVQQVQKALALYYSSHEYYPELKTCITGKDDLTKELIGSKLLDSTVQFRDPKWPDDLTKCIFYSGTAADYSIRYLLETDRAQAAGEHVVGP